MPAKKKEPKGFSAEYEAFFKQIQEEFTVTRENVLEAVKVVGLIKGRIRTYFIVEQHLRNKQKK